MYVIVIVFKYIRAYAQGYTLVVLKVKAIYNIILTHNFHSLKWFLSSL